MERPQALDRHAKEVARRDAEEASPAQEPDIYAGLIAVHEFIGHEDSPGNVRFRSQVRLRRAPVLRAGA